MIARAVALAAAAVALVGCAGLRHHSPRNAPGNVDLSSPMPGERGDPAAYAPPSDPGEHLLGIAPGVWVMPGVGRVGSNNNTTVEAGVQVHLAFGERDHTGSRGALGYPFDSWGVTAGWAFVQSVELGDGSTGATTGPVFVEAVREWFFMSAAAGIAVYPTPGPAAYGRAEGVDVGAQVTLQFAIVALRMRYIQDSGFEIFGGYQVSLPASLTWSR